MPLINCPACNRLVSDAAERCIQCGHPLKEAPATLLPALTEPAPASEPAPQRQVPLFRGPPHDCRFCGGALTAKREVEHGGTGCVLLVIGLLLTPFLIGILIMALGLHLGTKGKGYWQCRKCEARFDRKIKWWQYG